MINDLEQQKQNCIAEASKRQRDASDPKVSVWVEASAGTGKTKVLSDRVLRLLLNGVYPSRILCLTYTRAAAAEMSNRIAKRLSEWAVWEESKLCKELENLLGIRLEGYDKADSLIAQARRLFAILLDAPGGIKIQTIHSFCQEILKRFPLEAKISPYFEVMDDRSSKEAIEAIKHDILEGKLRPQSSEALAFLTAAADELKFPEIMQSITTQRNKIEEYLGKYPNVDEMIELTAKVLNVEIDETHENAETEFWRNLPQEDMALLVKALDAGKTSRSCERAAKLAEAIETKNIEGYRKILHTQGRARKDLLVTESKESFPAAEEIARKEADRLADFNAHLCRINLFYSTRAVLILADELLGRYQEYKKAHAKMDYNDLIMLTKRLLESPKVAEWVLFKLDGGIDNILIDEAQDTSPEQWAIVKALTEEFFAGMGQRDTQPTVFVVGDRKQSIYSFQGADPSEFEKMHAYFAKKATQFRDVSMEVSFRSTVAVLDAVNCVFAYDKARAGVVVPEQNIEHVPSRIGDGGRVELWPLIEADEDDSNDKVWLPPVERITTVSPIAKLAQQIAETIKAKVSGHEKLKSKGRDLCYRDFLILVQRRNEFVDEMVRACKNAGVNITGVDKINLLDQIAVNDLIALAKFILLPEDDLNLACLLKSPLIGLDDNDLFALCYGRGNMSLWQRLRQNPNYESSKDMLQKLLNLASEMRPFEVFAYVLNELHGRQKFVSRLGFECEDALDEFVNLSLNFEREHIPSMQLFVEWMCKDDVEIKRNLEQKDVDAVRLMTVHASKGLQAPIVILPDTLHLKEPKREAGWLKDKDVLFYPLGKDYYEDICEKLKDEEKASVLDEYHRLLYVALTRAEECLCICGYKKKNKPNKECWYEICREALPKIAVGQDNGSLLYEREQLIVPDKSKNKVEEIKAFEWPQWMMCAPKDDGPLAKPLTPSHQDESQIALLSPLEQNNDRKLYSRGRIIHKLLQFLPAISDEEREKRAMDFLKRQASDYPENESKVIVDEVLSLVRHPKFAPLFGKNSLAEVSLMGQVGDCIISGQIDRLVVEDDKVMVVDYKTNRPAAKQIEDIPEAYLKQMQAYRELIARIYQAKNIEMYILWTNTAEMMQIV